MIAHILVLLLLNTHSLAQDAPSQISLQVEVDKAVATTSDIIRLTVKLRKPKQFSDLVIPEVGGSIAGLRVIEFGDDKPEEDSGQVLLKKWYKLQADISGSYILPATKINYKDAQGKEHQAETSEIFIELKAPGTPNDSASEKSEDPNAVPKALNDIRDIQGPVSLGVHPLWKWVGGMGGVGALGAGFFLFFKFRKKKMVLVPPLPAHEVALRKLKELEALALHSSFDFKLFHFTLSEVARAYCEGRFLFPATDRTTEEIEAELEAEFEAELEDKPGRFPPLTKENRALLLSILKTTDRIKFTDYLPTSDQAQETLNSTIHFVNVTRLTLPNSELVSQEESVI